MCSAWCERRPRMGAYLLALARSGSGKEARGPVALRALVGDLAADYREQGRDVVTAEVADAVVTARPVLLRRALRNLIDNAVAYGVRARLSVAVGDGEEREIGRGAGRERACQYG